MPTFYIFLFAFLLSTTTVLATETHSPTIRHLQSLLADDSLPHFPHHNATENHSQLPHLTNESSLTHNSATTAQRNLAAHQLETIDSIHGDPAYSDPVSSLSNLSNSESPDGHISTDDTHSDSTMLTKEQHQDHPPIRDNDSAEPLPLSEHHSTNSGEDSDTSALSDKVAGVTELLRHNEALQRKILTHSAERDAATESLRNAIGRKNALLKEKQNALETRVDVERRLHEVYSQMPRYSRTLEILNKQSNDANRIIERLRNQHFWIMRQNKRLMSALRERGLEHWVERSVKDSVSPFVSDALVQGTASVVEPVLDGIEKLATANIELSKRMSLKLRKRVPIVEKPFYAGFVTYAVLLFPTVLVISLVLKVKRGFSKLSLGHAVILSNFYFLLLSGGCFVATLLGSVDVLLTFRHHNVQMFDFVMVLHGILFSIHALSHAWLTLKVRDKAALIHSFLLCAVGLHFFVHSYRHAMHNEDPHVDKRAYLVYTGIFLFVLYELTVKQIQKSQQSQDKKVMTLNNTSIAASENRVEAKAAALSAIRMATLPRMSFLSQHTHSGAVSTSAPRLQSNEGNPPIGELPPRPSVSLRSSGSSSMRPLRHVWTDAAAARDL